MEICELEGFFHQHYDTFRLAIGESDFETFAQLKTDQQRVEFVENILLERLDSFTIFKPTLTGIEKNLPKALEFKEQGNQALYREEWQKSLKCYNEALFWLPSENELDRSLILANRSASLFHLNKFSHALEDLRLAIDLNYPKEKLFKLLERKARCYFARKDLLNALENFRESYNALHYSNLSGEKRDKWMKQLKKVIFELDERVTQAKKYLTPVTHNVTKPFVPYVDKALYFDSSDNEGRFARTNCHLNPSYLLLKEKPHASVVCEEYCTTHCDRCCLRVEVLFPCPNCIDVVYCSEQCQQEALNTFHKYECRFLPFLRKLGANIVCFLALRIITQRREDYFLNLKEDLSQLSDDDVTRLPVDDYRRIYNYVTHSSQRSPEDSLQWTLMAVLINRMLLHGGYYSSGCTNSYIGSLLLHNLQVVTYNSHEIAEHQRLRANDSGTSVCIGAGLYPTLVFFNHSCDPGITRYFIGNAVYVRTLKNIPPGGTISENYGQLYARNERKDRQKKLFEGYKFQCNCQACQEDWPLVFNMNPSMVRLKCAGTEGCPNALVFKVEDDRPEVMTCDRCGALTDVSNSLESLMNTDMLNRYQAANNLLDQGEYDKALAKYSAIMTSLDEVLVQPYREYYLCQQGIRRCTIEMGNKYIEMK
ncbi:SET and MYND domain-containing protein 4-like [Uranotaenia lowii]|uniref:SET and MYND domain-containing protein 4-like n=1 Tax=Uranotaenia lowii TaxID=190385 RepID=UPI00247B0450|nr:SET and MYND domain-containing protein 4-like [Uranotaenia lowii]